MGGLASQGTAMTGIGSLSPGYQEFGAEDPYAGVYADPGPAIQALQVQDPVPPWLSGALGVAAQVGLGAVSGTPIGGAVRGLLAMPSFGQALAAVGTDGMAPTAVRAGRARGRVVGAAPAGALPGRFVAMGVRGYVGQVARGEGGALVVVARRVHHPIAMGKRYPSKAEWKRINHRLHDWRSVAISIVNRTGGMRSTRNRGEDEWQSSRSRRPQRRR